MNRLISSSKARITLQVTIKQASPKEKYSNMKEIQNLTWTQPLKINLKWTSMT